MKDGQEFLKEEMLAKLDVHHEKMMVRMNSQLEKMDAAVDVFEERLNRMDTTELEVNRESRKP
jgi:hypothetical protein